MPAPKSSRRVAKEFSDKKTAPLQEDTSLLEASEKMRTLKTTSFPVASGKKLVGFLNDQNPDRKAAGFGHDPATTRVKENMSTLEHYCTEDEDIRVAVKLMRKHKLKHLPVVDKKMRIVGILDLKKIPSQAM
jgi:CBS domain-containing protein